MVVWDSSPLGSVVEGGIVLENIPILLFIVIRESSRSNFEMLILECWTEYPKVNGKIGLLNLLPRTTNIKK